MLQPLDPSAAKPVVGQEAKQQPESTAVQAKATPQPASAAPVVESKEVQKEEKAEPTLKPQEENLTSTEPSSSTGKSAKDQWQWSYNIVNKVNKVGTNHQDPFQLVLLFRLNLATSKNLDSSEDVFCVQPQIYDKLGFFALIKFKQTLKTHLKIEKTKSLLNPSWRTLLHFLSYRL